MANIKQQKKRIRVAQRQRLENLRYRSAIKTHFKRLTARVNEGADDVAGEHVTLVRLIDKAAAKRALHANTASRKKSRAARVVAAGPQKVDAPRRRKASTAQTRARSKKS